MDDRALVDGLRMALTQVIGANRVPADVGADTPLGDGGLWLDSVDLLRFVLACEKHFGISFEPAEDLVPTNVRTLGTLADLVGRRIA